MLRQSGVLTADSGSLTKNLITVASVGDIHLVFLIQNRLIVTLRIIQSGRAPWMTNGVASINPKEIDCYD